MAVFAVLGATAVFLPAALELDDAPLVVAQGAAISTHSSPSIRCILGSGPGGGARAVVIGSGGRGGCGVPVPPAA